MAYYGKSKNKGKLDKVTKEEIKRVREWKESLKNAIEVAESKARIKKFKEVKNTYKQGE